MSILQNEFFFYNFEVWHFLVLIKKVKYSFLPVLGSRYTLPILAIVYLLSKNTMRCFRELIM